MYKKLIFKSFYIYNRYLYLFLPILLFWVLESFFLKSLIDNFDSGNSFLGIYSICILSRLFISKYTSHVGDLKLFEIIPILRRMFRMALLVWAGYALLLKIAEVNLSVIYVFGTSLVVDRLKPYSNDVFIALVILGILSATLNFLFVVIWSNILFANFTIKGNGLKLIEAVYRTTKINFRDFVFLCGLYFLVKVAGEIVFYLLEISSPVQTTIRTALYAFFQGYFLCFTIFLIIAFFMEKRGNT